MAKNWTYDSEEAILVRNFKDEEVGPLAMDMTMLFNDWLDLEPVQQQVIINGLKQKLDDSIARSKDQKLTEKEKAEVITALSLRIFKDREWNMPSVGKGTRGPSASLSIAVAPLFKMFTEELSYSREEAIEKIASTMGKSVEIIEQFVK